MMFKETLSDLFGYLLAILIFASLFVFYTSIFSLLFRFLDLDLQSFLYSINPDKTFILGMLVSSIIALFMAILSFITYRFIYNKLEKVFKNKTDV